MSELKKHPLPIDIDKQIENLKKLGLSIDDEDNAKDVLSNISYYRLVKAYSSTLKINGRYKENTTFEDIVSLYKFNAELRTILFIIIEHIEISLRANISNYFSLKYGSLEYKNLDNVGKHKDRYLDAISELEREIRRNSRSPFIRNFRNNYENGKIPFYAALEVSSFGTLSKIYKNLKNEDKNEIAKFYGVEYFYFESFIENFAHIRNICAHYGRLYNVRISKSPKLYKKYRNQNVSNNTLFASILSLKLVTNERVYNDFYIELKYLIEKYDKIEVKYMGFPENWQELIRPSTSSF